MKSVSGEVVSCETFPLSKAARVLSNFVAADNGASPAFAASKRRDLDLRAVNNRHSEEEEAGRIDVSLNVDVETRRHKSKNRRDRGEGKHKNRSMEVDRNVEDVGGAGNKSKINKETSDGVNAIQVKNDT
ncbi:uncharacterized protein [Spinacia oleracea]|uniref:Uncharacterized protein n=1 Tax=Spinacia oleracea TaxID=3562 RepID=A0ABM3R4I3_SPIOL|nr:uncharacterized protein LOC130465684 [Spinacia oleracea]